MPELPEVECVRRSLAALEGASIVSVEVARPEFVSAETRPDRLRPMIGAIVDRIDRHGKELALIERGPRRLRIRLGMTGRLLLRPLSEAKGRPWIPHEHVRWRVETDDGRAWILSSVDPRRFGDLKVFTSESAFDADRARLGPDALSIDARTLRRRLATTRRAIKATLLDQSVLAGVGNIYADEALFAARVHPRWPADAIDRGGVVRLGIALRRLLRRAIEDGGSTIRDYRNGRGESGAAQLWHQVYGRAGSPCRRCRSELLRDCVAQRTTVWCPHCQQVIHTDVERRHQSR